MKELQSLKSLVLSKEERGTFLHEIGSALPRRHFERIAEVFELLPQVVELLEQKNVSLAKLRALVFGAKTERARTLCGGPPPAPPKRAKRPGHGRRGQRSYTGARRLRTLQANLKPGDPCPGCLHGKVRKLKEPATSIQVSAQLPIQAVVHELQRLRCPRCNTLDTAKAPPGAEGEKYDLSTGVMVGMLRYGAGVPSHR